MYLLFFSSLSCLNILGKKKKVADPLFSLMNEWLTVLFFFFSYSFSSFEFRNILLFSSSSSSSLFTAQLNRKWQETHFDDDLDVNARENIYTKKKRVLQHSSLEIYRMNMTNIKRENWVSFICLITLCLSQNNMLILKCHFTFVC